MAPLAEVPGVRLISLQAGHGTDQIAALGGRFPVVELPGRRARDFSETAAIVSQLDLVIAPDTAVAHLAGGLGVPVWVGIPVAADWRWFVDREDSPWYPTMRLFRQGRLERLGGRVPSDGRGARGTGGARGRCGLRPRAVGTAP